MDWLVRPLYNCYIRSSSRFAGNIYKQNQPLLFYCVPCAWFSLSIIYHKSKRSTAIERKLVEQKVNRMLMKKPKRMELEIPINSPAPSSFPIRNPKKELNKNILLRERNVSNLLLNEIQETVDSFLGEEFTALGVQFNSVIMKSKNTCYVDWESQGVERDVEIKQILDRNSSYIRHLIIQSHVLGVVPKLKFFIDPLSGFKKEVEDILNSIDSIHEDQDAQDDDNVKEISKNIKESDGNPIYRMFRIDNHQLEMKIKSLKSRTDNLESDILLGNLDNQSAGQS